MCSWDIGSSKINNNCIYELGKLVSVTFDERTRKIKEYKLEKN